MKKILLAVFILVSTISFAGLPDKVDVCRQNPSEQGLYDRVDQFWIEDNYGALDCENPGEEKCEWVSPSNTINFENISYDLIAEFILIGKASGTINISGLYYSYYILEGYADNTGKVRFIKQNLHL